MLTPDFTTSLLAHYAQLAPHCTPGRGPDHGLQAVEG